MRRFIVGILAIIGATTLLIFLALLWSFHRIAPPSFPLLATNAPLVLSLTIGNESLSEQPHNGGLMSLVEGSPLSLHTIVEGINRAANDERVKGILLTLDSNTFKIGTAQEIRDALKTFKATGKFIYVYTNSFGEFSNGTLSYYLAAAATKIWMMPLGTLNFTGMMVEIPFAKKALGDLKIHPQMERREEYKGMVESITEDDFTPPYKENTQRLVDALTMQVVTDVAADRKLEVTEVRKILDTSPHLPHNAVTAHMIDQIGYKDQVKDAIEKLVGQKPTFYAFDSYVQSLNRPSKGEKIAIVYATGLISKGKSIRNPLLDDVGMDASEIAKSIQEAGENEDVKAIVLRIDSGGGEAIASDLIAREIDRAKSKKPVIISMSNYAASGAYWIACNANKIVAQPGSITGSIGVYAGKMVTQEFWEHYGIHWGEIHNGNNAGIWSTGQRYSEDGRRKFSEGVDQIYNLFLEKVAHGRSLSPEKVRQIAKGQVWTGIEAKEKGLVDVLGGLTTAIEIAKKEAGLATDAPIVPLHLPAPKSFIDLIFDRNRSNEAEVLARYPSLRMILRHLHTLFSAPQMEMKIDPLTS
jgi:protease-4